MDVAILTVNLAGPWSEIIQRYHCNTTAHRQWRETEYVDSEDFRWPLVC